MNSSLFVSTKSKEAALPFMWKDRRHSFHAPSEMTTKHLFFTIRMIWNHSAPSNLIIHPYEPYKFAAFYTNEYVAEAMFHIYNELMTRDDLMPYFIKCLDYMASNCFTQKKLKNKLKLLEM